MRIKCHAEHDGQGIVLRKIRCEEDALSLRCFLDEIRTPATIVDAGGQDGLSMILLGVSMADFAKLIADSNVELID